MIQKWVYKHYKNKLYEVIDVVVHVKTKEELVLYKALYDSPDFPLWTLWVRPKAMFFEKVSIDGQKVQRFLYVWDKKYENI